MPTALSLRCAREIKRPGVNDVAGVIRVSRVAVYSRLSGERHPSPRHLQQLLLRIGATPEEQAEAWRLLAAVDQERSDRLAPAAMTDRAAA